MGDNISIGIIGTLASILFAYLGYQKGAKKDAKEDAKAMYLSEANIKLSLEYIKQGVDIVKSEQKEIKDALITSNERIIRLEESAKQAHKRIDSVESLLKEVNKQC